MLRQPRIRGLLTIAFFTLLCGAASVAAQGGRIRPPDAIKCDPNHLTSFTGHVTSYRRTAARLSLRMRTDEETSEAFTLKFARGGDAIKFFLLRGEEFKVGDWKLIESRRLRLRPQMRATVWVCDDGSNPTIDWRPGERRGGSVF